MTSNDLSGPGSDVPGLPATYDLTLMEMSWGGKQAAFNGSGITTNTSYPLAEGEAITTHEQAGLALELARGMEAGFLWDLYASGGNRVVGQTFGAALPWDNFKRTGGRVVQAPFATDVYQGWVADTEGDLTYRLVAGTLKELPELSSKDTNHLRLGSLLYRPPVTNASAFTKEDRKLETGRHPLRGFDLVIDAPYADTRRLHGELFMGRANSTPVQEIDRDVLGMRWGADVWDGNVGASYIRTEGERNPAITGERQTLWALDGSYPALPWLDVFGAWAWSEYHRTGRLDGTAWVGGVQLRGPAKSEWRAQYQWLDENYELMGHHKIEHYPTNFHGLHATLTVPVPRGSLQALGYLVRQIDTNTRAGDTIFGDSYFPALADSARGTIAMVRVGGEYDLGQWRARWPKLTTYLERASFRKDAPDSASNDIDKQVTEWYMVAAQPIMNHLTAEAGVRMVGATGRWQAMRFHHRQTIPELALCYRLKRDGKDRARGTLIYQRYNFVDSIAASAGQNNYAAHQVIGELWFVF